MKEPDYRAVIKSPDGDCAETTGKLFEVIKWAEKFTAFLSDGFDVDINKMEEGSESGCIGIT
jgi:hypothetical protein